MDIRSIWPRRCHQHYGFHAMDSATTDTFSELVTWLSGKSGVAFFNHPINTYRVSVSADDAEENTTTKSVGLSSSDLEIVYDPDINANQLVGIRFIIPYLQRAHHYERIYPIYRQRNKYRPRQRFDTLPGHRQRFRLHHKSWQHFIADLHTPIMYCGHRLTGP